MATMTIGRVRLPLLLLLLVVSLTGCQSIMTKVKDVATKAAITAADKRANQFYDSKIVPKLDELEDQIGTLDVDGDGTFSSEELQSAIISKVKADFSEGGMGGMDWSSILMLIGLWVAQKFGFKFGPKGFQGFRNWKSSRARDPDVDLG